MELGYRLLSMYQVAKRFPCVFLRSVSFPFGEVVELFPDFLAIQELLNFVLLFFVVGDDRRGINLGALWCPFQQRYMEYRVYSHGLG